MRNTIDWEVVFDQLAADDFVIIDNFFEENLYVKLKTFFSDIEHQELFKKAAIGASGEEHIINEVRGDYTYWLDKERDVEILGVFDALEELRRMLNRYCFLSISSFEFHLAHYPVGSFYKKHLDQFEGRNNRLVSVVIYLNDDWQQGDGGELKVYPIGNDPVLVSPFGNRCVLFRSDELLHEVLTAQTSRKSLTGWMLYQPTKLVNL